MDKPASEHHAARMFCIKDGKVVLAEAGMTLSHQEWFVKEGWIRENGNGDEERFFQHVVSGQYAPDNDVLYCFREMDFGDDPGMIDIVVKHIARLEKVLGCGSHTKVFIGPP